MRRFLLDTNSAGHCIHRRQGVHERVKEARRHGHRIGIAIPVLAELWAGAEYSQSRDRNVEIVSRNLGLFRTWPFSSEAARRYGQIFATLRKAGGPMQVIDMMIAAIAFTLPNCTVVSSDSDLYDIDGLSVENWTI